MRIEVEKIEKITAILDKATREICGELGLRTSGEFVPVLQIHELTGKPGEPQTLGKVFSFGPPERVELTIRAVGIDLADESDFQTQCVAVARKAFEYAFDSHSALGVVFLDDGKILPVALSECPPRNLPQRLHAVADRFAQLMVADRFAQLIDSGELDFGESEKEVMS